MQMILSENVKAVSNGALQQLDLDLVQCEQFAASEPIQGLEVTTRSNLSQSRELFSISYLLGGHFVDVLL